MSPDEICKQLFKCFFTDVFALTFVNLACRMVWYAALSVTVTCLVDSFHSFWHMRIYWSNTWIKYMCMKAAHLKCGPAPPYTRIHTKAWRKQGLILIWAPKQRLRDRGRDCVRCMHAHVCMHTNYTWNMARVNPCIWCVNGLLHPCLHTQGSHSGSLSSGQKHVWWIKIAWPWNSVRVYLFLYMFVTAVYLFMFGPICQSSNNNSLAPMLSHKKDSGKNKLLAKSLNWDKSCSKMDVSEQTSTLKWTQFSIYSKCGKSKQTCNINSTPQKNPAHAHVPQTNTYMHLYTCTSLVSNTSFIHASLLSLCAKMYHMGYEGMP